MKEFRLIHTTWAKTTAIAASDMTVQMLAPDVSVVFVPFQYLDQGNKLPQVNHAVLIVAIKHSEQWKIASGQITKVAG